MANTIKNIFAGTKPVRNVTKYMLTRGVVDYSALEQWDLYETGYGFLIVLKIPDFLNVLKNESDDYKVLIENYRHLLEYDFKNMDGIEDMGVNTNELSDGVNNLNIITQTTMQSASTFSMRYNERSGSIFTKVHELFLRGVKDPRSTVKRYNGILKTGAERDKSALEAGFEHETFQFLYFTTDNTARFIEKAYLIVSAQPTSAETSMYNYTKGDISWRELNIAFNGYPITGPLVTDKAQKFLDWINENTEFEEAKFAYDALAKMPNPGETGGYTVSSKKSSW